MVIDLEPCPFCGALGAFVRDDCPTMWVECRFCGAQGPFACGETRTAEAWNARAAEVADLIDRPTCRNVSGYQDTFKCSGCGYKTGLIAEVCNEHGESFHMPLMLSRCPNCGAAVTEED
nr:MAG TPA: RNA polymerase I [Caudoviricetes sp.]